MDRSPSNAALAASAAKRSALARRRTEDAIRDMVRVGEQVTFKAVAQRAKVSRQYLYTNFKTPIEELRGTARRPIKRAPSVDMALRKALTEARKEVAELRRRIERALGEAEHWRENCKSLATENAELSSRLGKCR